jgi:hypothetical protein
MNSFGYKLREGCMGGGAVERDVDENRWNGVFDFRVNGK